MTIKVGIPRALLYYEFEKLWVSFYQLLGAETVISGPTTKRMLDQGAGMVVDEACLPVKVFFGHAMHLAQQADYLFVPRMVSIQPKAYICPKLMGLPDMLAASRAKLPPLIKPTFNQNRTDEFRTFLQEAGSIITQDEHRLADAWQEACHLNTLENLRQLKEYTYPLAKEDMTILILGHRYLLGDDFLNMNLLKKLERLGCKVMLPQHLWNQGKKLALKHLPKEIFWSTGRDMLGAAYCFSNLPGRIGVILLTAFGCGIDSFIGNMITRHLHKKGIPYLNLTLDEHSGEAGLTTRVEAFTDMMRWRRIVNENHLSAYGQHMGTLKGAPGLYRSGSSGTSSIQ